MALPVPKLIRDMSYQPKVKAVDLGFEEELSPSTALGLSLLMPGLAQIYLKQNSKAFWYLLSSFIAGSLVILLAFISILNEEILADIASFLEAIPFWDITISSKTYRFIEELNFPNPFSIFVLITCAIYSTLVAMDTVKSLNRIESGNVVVLPYYRRELFNESFSASFAIHAFLLFSLIFGGFLFLQPPKPKVQISQIEFIPQQIVSKKKPPPQTKRRAPKQSIDQGKHDPKKKVSPITKPVGKPKASPKPTKPSSRHTPKPKLQKPIAKPSPKPKLSSKPIRRTSPTKPQKPTLRPAPKAVPKPKPISNSRVQDLSNKPSRYIPAPSRYKSSPGASTSSSDTATSSAPKNISSSASSAGSSSAVARLSNLPSVPSNLGGGRGGAFGMDGNPGKNPFGDAPASVAAKADVDFGPYMAALQRKVKLAWKPPRGSESNIIVVAFEIGRDGRLTDLKLVRPSGNIKADEAAIQAIMSSAPFQALPVGAPNSVPIEFTFDYNVFYQQRR